MFGSGEGFVFDCFHIGFDGGLDVGLAGHEVFDEFGGFAGEDAEHVVHDQNLSVAIGTRAYADGGA